MSAENNGKKRKDIIVDNSQSPISIKKQQKNTLQQQQQQQQYSSKSTTSGSKDDHQRLVIINNCPVCNQVLQDLSLLESSSHVGACLNDMMKDDDDDDFDDQISDVLDKNEIINDQIMKQKTTPINTSLYATPSLTAIRNDESIFAKTHFSITNNKDTRLMTVPHYKRIADTNLVVDAFSYGDIANCEGYLLSHFHSDHYAGIDANWTHGPIYCSQITAQLLINKLGVVEDFINPLPVNKPYSLSSSPNRTITLIDANHCPGSVMFLIDVIDGKRYLHTGDFRASPRMCLDLMGKEIDILYLDTTYLNPMYSFPSQISCIRAACEIAKNHKILLERNNKSSDKKGRLLVVVGTYTLGKEHIFIEIAKALNSKIFVTDEKRKILNCFKDRQLDEMLTDQIKEAQVHVIPLWHIVPKNLEAYFNSLKPAFTEMIAFKPTGWTFKGNERSQQYKSLESIISERPDDLISSKMLLKASYDTFCIKIYDIPYSEHSSFRELAVFIASLDIRHIIPTVNADNEENRFKMLQLLESWIQDKQNINKDGKNKIFDYPSLDYW
ncbi:beta-lactamase-like protein [Cokeromyces recurvatus]|uniref:beta-lactamase-like protein n=1 Tax=Cokeromyces recurvatus TaxID=90255 RepID=UPI002220E335|nr:beta-lactamase-like protein [Cokeromyces recurvatus]KAI7905385.1 beta-lactamase-like protein [Cokeromyces recurvatus]